MKQKIWKIAQQRYKGWRATFSATYKAFNTYDERMKNRPEDLDIVEWHYLIKYFGSKKFKVQHYFTNLITESSVQIYIDKHYLFAGYSLLAARTLQIDRIWEQIIWWVPNHTRSAVGKM